MKFVILNSTEPYRVERTISMGDMINSKRQYYSVRKKRVSCGR